MPEDINNTNNSSIQDSSVGDTTSVMLNGHFVKMSVFDIFDWRKYDHFVGVTYSASSKFVVKYLFYYRSIELIVGIANYNLQASIAKTFDNLNSYHQREWSTPLTTDVHKDFLGADLYIPRNGIMHSKIFLLSNPDEDRYRVVTGSANLSESAFNSSKNQYEEVIVSDSKADYDREMERYEQIKQNAMGYVDRDTKEILRKKGYLRNS